MSVEARTPPDPSPPDEGTPRVYVQSSQTPDTSRASARTHSSSGGTAHSDPPRVLAGSRGAEGAEGSAEGERASAGSGRATPVRRGLALLDLSQAADNPHARISHEEEGRGACEPLSLGPSGVRKDSQLLRVYGALADTTHPDLIRRQLEHSHAENDAAHAHDQDAGTDADGDADGDADANADADGDADPAAATPPSTDTSVFVACSIRPHSAPAALTSHAHSHPHADGPAGAGPLSHFFVPTSQSQGSPRPTQTPSAKPTTQATPKQPALASTSSSSQGIRNRNHHRVRTPPLQGSSMFNSNAHTHTHSQDTAQIQIRSPLHMNMHTHLGMHAHMHTNTHTHTNMPSSPPPPPPPPPPSSGSTSTSAHSLTPRIDRRTSSSRSAIVSSSPPQLADASSQRLRRARPEAPAHLHRPTGASHMPRATGAMGATGAGRSQSQSQSQIDMDVDWDASIQLDESAPSSSLGAGLAGRGVGGVVGVDALDRVGGMEVEVEVAVEGGLRRGGGAGGGEAMDGGDGMQGVEGVERIPVVPAPVGAGADTPGDAQHADHTDHTGDHTGDAEHAEHAGAEDAADDPHAFPDLVLSNKPWFSSPSDLAPRGSGGGGGRGGGATPRFPAPARDSDADAAHTASPALSLSEHAILLPPLSFDTATSDAARSNLTPPSVPGGVEVEVEVEVEGEGEGERDEGAQQQQQEQEEEEEEENAGERVGGEPEDEELDEMGTPSQVQRVDVDSGPEDGLGEGDGMGDGGDEGGEEDEDEKEDEDDGEEFSDVGSHHDTHARDVAERTQHPVELAYVFTPREIMGNGGGGGSVENNLDVEADGVQEQQQQEDDQMEEQEQAPQRPLEESLGPESSSHGAPTAHTMSRGSSVTQGSPARLLKPGPTATPAPPHSASTSQTQGTPARTAVPAHVHVQGGGGVAAVPMTSQTQEFWGADGRVPVEASRKERAAADAEAVEERPRTEPTRVSPGKVVGKRGREAVGAGESPPEQNPASGGTGPTPVTKRRRKMVIVDTQEDEDGDLLVGGSGGVERGKGKSQEEVAVSAGSVLPQTGERRVPSSPNSGTSSRGRRLRRPAPDAPTPPRTSPRKAPPPTRTSPRKIPTPARKSPRKAQTTRSSPSAPNPRPEAPLPPPLVELPAGLTASASPPAAPIAVTLNPPRPRTTPRHRSFGLSQHERSPQVKKCGACGTRLTTMWRKGPDGPGTLCAKCGSYYARKGTLEGLDNEREGFSGLLRGGLTPAASMSAGLSASPSAGVAGTADDTAAETHGGKKLTSLQRKQKVPMFEEGVRVWGFKVDSNYCSYEDSR
ncbi:hypothetical protein M427DRAFT_28757 [Gonapodya prolifera JEL478]|uniref:GATA-type domain-containing protein n=1 Tax=Gonapodya prolifera (strain JEL478) TaxID=1344416 RepID=A0A139ATH9_GONPJ|nr:hypothetical protein M427DRAFT_28757 [Gonapodya prolifera JEL478]|eukprot:KXS19873.1 hypothetical protein M427DRAFT_28757 [Gonapodya prolifera JEL478]